MQMNGLYLVPPHGELIHQGRKAAIVKNRPFPELIGTHILVSGDKAYGELAIATEEVIAAADFDTRFPEHRVSIKRRKDWWPDATHFYSYPIQSFTPYPSPLPVEVPAGVQTMMGEVKFKEEEMPYSMDNPPRPSKNWPAEDKKKCIAAANAVLKNDGSEQDAIFACIRAAGRTKHPGGEDKKDYAEETDLSIAAGIVSTLYLVIPEHKETEPELIALPLTDQVIEPEVEKVEPEIVPVELEIESEVKPEPADAIPTEPQGEVLPAATISATPPIPPTEPEVESAVEDKIGKRLRTDKVSELSGIKDALERFWKWITNQDEQPSEVEPAAKFLPAFSVKEINGESYLVIWPTNAFIDREGEIFETQALQKHVDASRDKPIKGEAWYRHWRGTKFGDVIFQDLAGRFMVEVVRFDPTPIGQAFKALFSQYPNGHPQVSSEGWGASHGYVYRPEDRLDAVYEWFDKRESSVLPLSVASNPHNPKPEVITVNEKAQAELTTLVGADITAQIIHAGEAKTEEKEREGVAYKEIDTQALVEAISKEFKMEDLAIAFKSITDAVIELKQELETVKARLVETEKSTNEKLAEKESELPRFPWDAAFRPSQAKSTIIQDGDALKTVVVKAPPAIERLATIVSEGR